MEEEEKFLGGFASPYLARGWIRGYAIYATTKRVIGVKKRMGALVNEGPTGGLLGVYARSKLGKGDSEVQSKLAQGGVEKEIKELFKSKDFELSKEEIKCIQLKEPGRLKPGHLKILQKKGKEIEIRIWPYPGLFEKVGELMQDFFPEALEIEG